MNCEMCGKEAQLFFTELEGTTLKVCQNCGKHGTVKGAVKQISIERKQDKKPIILEPQKIDVIVKDYGMKIKNARERKKLTQEEVAKLLHEKESLIHHLESSTYEPNMELARKLEKFFSIKLIDQYDKTLDFDAGKHSAKKELTLGDIAIVRRKK